MAGKVVYTILYTDLSAKTPDVFETYMSVDFGSTYSSLLASASFGVDKLNNALSAFGKLAHETATYILSVDGIPSRDGTVYPVMSGTWATSPVPHWSGSAGADGDSPYILASLTGSIYDEATNLSAVAKKAYLKVKAIR